MGYIQYRWKEVRNDFKSVIIERVVGTTRLFDFDVTVIMGQAY